MIVVTARHFMAALLLFVAASTTLHAATTQQEAQQTVMATLNKNVVSALSSHYRLGTNREQVLAAYHAAKKEGASDTVDLLQQKMLHHAEEFLRTKTPLSAIERTHLLSLVSTLLMQPTPYAPNLSNDDLYTVHSTVYAAMLALLYCGNRYGYKGDAVINDELVALRSGLGAAVGPHPTLAKKIGDLFALLQKSIATIEPPAPWITKKRILLAAVIIAVGILAKKTYQSRATIYNRLQNPVSSVVSPLFHGLVNVVFRILSSLAAGVTRVGVRTTTSSLQGALERPREALNALYEDLFRR